MKNISILIIIVLVSCIYSKAENTTQPLLKKFEYNVAAGFNLGATSPMGLPSDVRAINSYKPTANLAIAGYATMNLNHSWGIRAGIRFEYKGMETGITVKNWPMTVNIQSGDVLGMKRGYFTGDIKNKTRMGYLTIPLSAIYRVNKKWELHAGWYFAYAIDRNFTGKVIEGQIRETPLHPVISITKADYNYSEDLQKFDTGAEIGASFKVYRNLAIDANLTWGIISVLNPDKRQIDMNNYNVYLNIGVSYAL